MEGRPVLAHRDSVSYRAGKFIRRNKVGALAALLVVLSLLGGILATAWQANKALQERDRARRQATKADRVNAFLQNILGFSDPTWLSPNPQRNREATIADALQQAAARASTELADEPEILATVQFTIGWTYKALGQLEAAEPLLRASLELRRNTLGSDHQDTAQSLVGLGESFMYRSRFAEMEVIGAEAVEIYRRAARRGEVDKKWFAIALNDLAVAQVSLGKTDAAEALMEEALVVTRDFVGMERAGVAVMRANLGVSRREKGDLEGALAHSIEALREYEKLPGGLRFERGAAVHNLATVRMWRGEHDAAETLAHEAFDIFQKTVGDKHPYTPRPFVLLATNEYRRGDYAKARQHADRALQMQSSALPEGQVEFAYSWTALGRILTRLGDVAEGEAYLRRALDLRNRVVGASHQLTAEAQAALADCLSSQGRFDEAEQLLVAADETYRARLNPADPRTVELLKQAVAFFEARGQPERAAAYRDRLAAVGSAI
jgi:serine/threonine-protein kinase